MTATAERSAPAPDAAGPPEVPLLRARGVKKKFGPVQALAGVDLDIPAGQVTALVGDNGAGKSVLIKCIAGIHVPDAGEFTWEGQPVRIRTPRDAAALGIETVYQDLALCDNLDIVQNMFLGREHVRHGVLDEDRMELAAKETLHSLGATTVTSVRQPVGSLSGGQRQAYWQRCVFHWRVFGPTRCGFSGHLAQPWPRNPDGRSWNHAASMDACRWRSSPPGSEHGILRARCG